MARALNVDADGAASIIRTLTHADGDAAVRYVYMSYCNEEGDSGSPPIGWARWDRQTTRKRSACAAKSLL